MSDTVGEYVAWRAEQQNGIFHERIERAVEEALADGEHGVLADPNTMTAAPSPDVPHGELHYLPIRLDADREPRP